jgi:4-alpha-glucanotransferase
LLTERRAGACLHLTSLPGDHGIGGLGASAYRFIDQLAAMGLSVWQFLPIGPTAYADSPYQPLSVFAHNTLLIDVEFLRRDGLLDPNHLEALRELPTDEVDYGRLIPLKRRLLARAVDRFTTGASVSMRADYAAFVDQHNAIWLHDYALFQILKTGHSEKPWPEWDLAFRHRESAALRALERRARAQIDGVKIAQFLFFKQWNDMRNYANERGIKLFGDVPIYISLDSADAWCCPELVMINRDGNPAEVAGVPPDYFSADGQLWGNPIYDWNYHRDTGYQWWIDRLRHATTLVDMLRLDHFRGFDSYWSIPSTAETAREGCWLPGPADELFEALDAALGSFPIIAEDLGMITPEVNALRERWGFPGMKVLQFLIGVPGFHASQIPEDCVCYTGTHDNDTTIGWFRGGTDNIRTPEEFDAWQRSVLAATGGSAESVHIDMMRFALESPARISMLPVQDMLGLGSEARLNKPGTTAANWRWRLGRDALDEAVIERIHQAVQQSARCA